MEQEEELNERSARLEAAREGDVETLRRTLFMLPVGGAALGGKWWTEVGLKGGS